MAEWLQMAASLVSVLMLCGVIFNFSVVVKTLATYYYSKEKRERTNS